jgi:hypothetical protein
MEGKERKEGKGREGREGKECIHVGTGLEATG